MPDTANQITSRTKESNKAKFANAINLNAKTPIPIQYGSDSFTYSSFGKKYIPFLGNDDNFPNLLLEARLTSPTQNACINAIADSTIGKGISLTNEKNPDKDFIDFIDNCNNDNQSLDEILRGSTDGERSLGNQFIEVVRGKIGTERYVKIYLHSLLYCRLGERDEKTGRPKSAIISKSFSKKGFIPQQKDRVEIPLYNPKALNKSSNWFKRNRGEESTMLHFKNSVTGIDDYGLPPGIASLRFQVLEGKSAQYNLDMFANNLVLSGALVMKSAMTQEEAKINAQSILATHSGDGKQGRISVISSESGIEDFTFLKYDTEKEGSFLEMDKLCEKKIVAANGWASEFINTGEGSLGKGEGYLRSLWDMKEASTLKPLRKRLIKKVLNPIVEIWADWTEKKEVKNYQFDIQSDMPFSFLGDLKPEHFMQVNEARTLAGQPVDPKKEGVYISETLKSKTDVQA